MGNMKDMLSMIPGMGSKIKDLDINDDSFKGIEAMINSMTPEERADPDLIDGSRKKDCQRRRKRHTGSQQLHETVWTNEGHDEKHEQNGSFRQMMPGMKR